MAPPLLLLQDSPDKHPFFFAFPAVVPHIAQARPGGPAQLWEADVSTISSSLELAQLLLSQGPFECLPLFVLLP